MLNFFKRQMIMLGISFLLTFIDRIKYLPLQSYLSYLGSEVQQVVDVVLDNNPNDKEQLHTLWLSQKNAFIANTTATTVSFADTIIKDERVKFVVKNLLRDLQQVLTTGVIKPGSNLEAYMKSGKFPINGPEDIIL